VLTLVSPKLNAAVTGAGVTVSGKVTDASGVGRVEVKVNGVLAATLTPNAPTNSFDYSGSVIPEQGTNTIVVTAFDIQGNASASITRTVKFVNLRPALPASTTASSSRKPRLRRSSSTACSPSRFSQRHLHRQGDGARPRHPA
jgi:hypothetical protein